MASNEHMKDPNQVPGKSPENRGPQESDRPQGTGEQQEGLQKIVDEVSLDAQKETEREIAERLSADLEKAGKKKGGKKFLKRHKKLFITLGVIAVLLVGGGIYINAQLGKVRQVMANMTTQMTAKVERRDISVSLSGSGTLKAADSYTITSLVEGDILSADFEEGDIVEKDTVLYEVDSSDIASSIEQAEITLSQSQRAYQRSVESKEDLLVKAPEEGSVVSLEAEEGDEVKMGDLVAVVRNGSVMSVTLPFAADDAASFKVGQKAVVTLDGTFEQVAGTVSKVTAVNDVSVGSLMVRQVTIDVNNPGGISSGQAATAVVGKVACASGGAFEYKTESQVLAEVSGKVQALNVKEGDFVAKDQVLVTLQSDEMDDEVERAADSVKNAEISLENSNDKLDNFTIKSPISGTIIEKNYKEGDKMESAKTLCTIFDLSYLTMTLNIDELDISKIQVGQKVEITAEAVEGKTYEGVVTKLNINGTTQNGVTSYPVTVRIDKTDGLLPGMNVDAVIVVESKENVLSVPVSAVTRGNKVLVKTDGAGTPAEGEEGQNKGTGAPEGYEYVEVTPGVSDEDYIEIVEGLNEGDEVAYTPAQSNGANMMMYYGMGGGDVSVSYGGGGPGGGPSGGPGGDF